MDEKNNPRPSSPARTRRHSMWAQFLQAGGPKGGQPILRLLDGELITIKHLRAIVGTGVKLNIPGTSGATITEVDEKPDGSVHVALQWDELL